MTIIKFDFEDTYKMVEETWNLFEKLSDSSRDLKSAYDRLDKIHHILAEVFDIPDFDHTQHMRDFIYNYERAHEHKGTPDEIASLKKTIKAAKLVLDDLKVEEEKRKVLAETEDKNNNKK